ncbi:hypothetical protein F8S13_05485 [Chloroflexia bacterium SDU3-3]|nr:hypothetical protein F8S13_05485 [Chloroflexia bacterium SDU3-3]
MNLPSQSHILARWALPALLLPALAACSAQGAQQAAAPTAAPTAPAPAAQQRSAAAPDAAPGPISISQPQQGAAITSPQPLSGQLAQVPPQGGLIYRLYDAESILLATGTVQASGQVGQPGTFEAQVVYTALEGGPGVLQVVQRNDLAGPAVALASQVVQISPNITTPPTAGAIVGGVQNLVPPAAPSAIPSAAPSIVPSAVPTAAPAAPSAVPTTAPAAPTAAPSAVPTAMPSAVPSAYPAPQSTSAYPAPQGTSAYPAPRRTDPSAIQIITLDAPSSGASVGSPLAISGSTSAIPLDGNLHFRILDAQEQELGSGTFNPQLLESSSTFSAQLAYRAPAEGSSITLILIDRADFAAGAPRATMSATFTYRASGS